jgi:hypothetical protein
LNSVVIKSVDFESVRHAMDELAARWLVEHAELEEIIVFGSFSTGNFVPGSDLDVCLLVAGSKPRRDPAEFMPARFPVPLELFVFSHTDVEQPASPPIWKAAQSSRWRYMRTAGSSRAKASPPCAKT